MRFKVLQIDAVRNIVWAVRSLQVLFTDKVYFLFIFIDFWQCNDTDSWISWFITEAEIVYLLKAQSACCLIVLDLTWHIHKMWLKVSTELFNQQRSIKLHTLRKQTPFLWTGSIRIKLLIALETGSSGSFIKWSKCRNFGYADPNQSYTH